MKPVLEMKDGDEKEEPKPTNPVELALNKVLDGQHRLEVRLGAIEQRQASLPVGTGNTMGWAPNTSDANSLLTDILASGVEARLVADKLATDGILSLSESELKNKLLVNKLRNSKGGLDVLSANALGRDVGNAGLPRTPGTTKSKG